jgi:hypothetical protein
MSIIQANKLAVYDEFIFGKMLTDNHEVLPALLVQT